MTSNGITEIPADTSDRRPDTSSYGDTLPAPTYNGHAVHGTHPSGLLTTVINGQVQPIAATLDDVAKLLEWESKQPAPSGPFSNAAMGAVRSLEYGGHAEVWGLGDERATEQYRKLVHLVGTAIELDIPVDLRKRVTSDLRRYALWVRVSLESLSATGQSLGPGMPPWPDLRRKPAHDTPWQPSPVPQAWHMAITQEPGDMAYLPAH